MIMDYFRPQTLNEALTLLTQPNTVPLGGGTLLTALKTDSVKVVDLQALGLDSVNKKGNELEIGATVTLQQLFNSQYCQTAMKSALKLEAPLNIRNSATVAGTLVASDGRSPFATALLAMDAKIEQAIFDNSRIEYRISNIGEYLPLRSTNLITKITILLNTKLAFECVSRTHADKPIICAVLTQWSSGRTRLALGGYGKSPILAMDGTEADGLDSAARNAYHEANDDWASAEYRMDVAATLAKRCLENIA